LKPNYQTQNPWDLDLTPYTTKETTKNPRIVFLRFSPRNTKNAQNPQK
jgi:hypothetical protein